MALVLMYGPPADEHGRREHIQRALPERDILPAEQSWSNSMDPRAAAKVLDDSDEC